MKKSLKKSEILENLKRVLKLPVISDVVRFSIIELDTFKVRYVLIIKYKDSFATVVVSLIYGWIQCEYDTFVNDYGLCYKFYLEKIADSTES